MNRNCQRISRLFTLLLVFFAANYSTSAQETSSGYSGVFAGLTVGVNQRDKTISGYFFDQTGWNETTKSATFTCAFYLKGTFKDNKYEIITWYPGESRTINGSLKFIVVDGQTEIEIRLNSEHGGCGNVQPFAVDKANGGGTLVETKRGDWSVVRVVSAKRAYFYKQPSVKAKEKQYLIRYDPIRIFQSNMNWVEAEFEGEKITRGWLQVSDLFAAEPKMDR